MNDTSRNATSASGAQRAATRPSLFKAASAGAGGRAARAPRPPVERVPTPRSIDAACALVVMMAVALLARALLLLGSTPMLQDFVVKLNDKAKTPIKPYTQDKIDNSVHLLRQGAFVQAGVFGLALLLLAWALRRTRSASGTRWAVLVVFVYTQMPFYVLPISGLPIGVNIAGIVLGVASIAVILLVFAVPQSSKYFRDSREASVPPELRGQPRRGLASLFGSKRERPGAVGAARPAAATGRATAAPKTKAKGRSDADAVARGAELARSRAKASKSRRTGG